MTHVYVSDCVANASLTVISIVSETVTDALVKPTDVALTVAVPALIALTTPSSTETISGFNDFQVTEPSAITGRTLASITAEEPTTRVLLSSAILIDSTAE